MSQDLEKRKYSRTTKPFALNLRLKPDENQKETSASWDMVSAKNLSAGGVFLYYNKNLGIGSFVELRINVPGSTTSICCIGEITRTKKHPKSPIYETAISFTEIKENQREVINKIIEENLQE